MLGCEEYHDNCTDNLMNTLYNLGFKSIECPSHLNLWINIPVNIDGEVTFSPPLSTKNDYIIFEAKMDCILIMSVCPMDIVPINGKECIIKEIHYQLLSD